jgi:hypothetical protein
MKFRTSDQLSLIVGNNRTIAENVRNGIKAWETRKQRLIEKAENRGVNVRGLFLEYKQAVYEWDEDLSTFGIIAKEIQWIRKSCFERWGDRNHIDRVITRNWFEEKAFPLDVQLQEINEMHFRNIEPDDVVDFIITYPRREDYPPLRIIGEKSDLFAEMVGFRPNRNMVINKIYSPELEDYPF